jgi:hypothetical protein
MARFSDDPIKNPLSGAEILAATDPATMNDVGMTPLIITQFAQKNMGLATGSTQGVVSGPNGDKLTALPTAAALATQLGELAQVAIPIFIGAPANGSLQLYQHVLSVPWRIQSMALAVSAGSTSLSLTKNGNAIQFTPGGYQSAVGTVSTTQLAADTSPNDTFQPGDVLGISLGSTSGNCANLRCSVYATAQL